MTATLTFDEEDDLLTALQGYKYRLALWDLDQFLRGEMKYNDILTAEEYNYAELIREKLHEILRDYHIALE